MINWSMKLVKDGKGYHGSYLINMNREILKTMNKCLNKKNNQLISRVKTDTKT